MVVIKPSKSFYTDEQLDVYLNRIGKPSIKGHPTVESLNSIVHGHLTAFPFENTEMHYSATGTVDISPEATYKRFLVDKTGGGCCYSQVTLMMGMLLALGYRTYACGSRVNFAPGADTDAGGPIFEVRAHIVLLVQLPESADPTKETYLVDVGYGLGLVRPILLKEGEEVAGAGGVDRHRITKSVLPDNALDTSDPESRRLAEEWVVQVNIDRMATKLPEGSWRTLFSFTLQQVNVADMEFLLYAVQNRPYGIFWSVIFTVIYLRGEEENGYKGIKVIMGDKFTIREEGKFVHLEGLKTDEDRLAILEKHFGVTYPAGAAAHIRGRRAAALGGQAVAA